MGSIQDDLRSEGTLQDALSDVIGRPLPERKGLILCPGHKEKNPSFSVDPEAGFGTCFSCGLKGDVAGLAITLGYASDFPGLAEKFREKGFLPAKADPVHRLRDVLKKWNAYLADNAPALRTFGWTVEERHFRGIRAKAIIAPSFVTDGTSGQTKIRGPRNPSTGRLLCSNEGEKGVTCGLIGQMPRAGEDIDGVLLSAGETDAIALINANAAEGLRFLVVTTSLGETAPLNGLAAAFAGAKVYVIADNDGPGKTGGLARAEAIREAGAASARVIFPKKGHDAREWLQKHGTLTELLHEPEPEKPDSTNDLVTFLTVEEEDPPMLIDSVFQRDALNIVFGPPSSGKSWWLQALCIDLAQPDTFPVESIGRFVHRHEDGDRVLWVHGTEDPSRRVRSRARQLWETTKAHELGIDPVEGGYVIRPIDEGIDTPEGLAILREELKARGTNLLIVDTATSALMDANIGSNEEIKPFLQEMHKLRDEFGLTIIIVCHTRKPPSSKDGAPVRDLSTNSMMGASAWRGLSDGILLIHAMDGATSESSTFCVLKGKELTHRIAKEKWTLQASGRFLPYVGPDDDEDEAPAPRPAGVPQCYTDLNAVYEWLSARMGEWFPKSAVFKALDITRTRFDNAWRSLPQRNGELAGLTSKPGPNGKLFGVMTTATDTTTEPDQWLPSLA